MAELVDFDATKSFDAIVVGAGACGQVALNTLGQAGMRVLVLDAGPSFLPGLSPYTMFGRGFGALADPAWLRILPSRAIRLARRVFRSAGRLRQPVQTQCFAWEMSPLSFVDDTEFPYCTPNDAPYVWIRALGEGGRLRVPGHGRQYYRFAPDDFEEDDEAITWPIGYDDLAPCYSAIEQNLSLSGAKDGSEDVPDSEIATLGRLRRSDEKIIQSIRARWPALAPIQSRYAEPPRTVTLANDRVHIQPYAMVRAVALDDRGEIQCVHWLDRRSRSLREARAPIVFLCASTLETTRILLATSRLARRAIDHASGCLGRYLSDHILVKAETMIPALDNEDVLPPPGHCVYIPRFDRRAGFSNAQRAGVQVYVSPAGGSRSYLTAVSFGQMRSRKSNQVQLHPTLRDAYGSPALHIECRHDEGDLALAKDQTEGLNELCQMFGVEGPCESALPAFPGTSVHECGTARMGLDPTTSVVDPENRVWGCKGLYVTDGASMPAMGPQNPTLTMMAITARACATVLSSSTPSA